jgi:tRNA(fMet)-specific endonuclease VapC
MFILDTDHVSFWLRGNPLVQARTIQARDDVATTVVSVQELFNGWAGRINNLVGQETLVFAYTNLWQTTEFIREFPVMNFDQAADDCYVRLLQGNPPLQKKRLRQDMRIAAIALSLDATVVTRNRKDFGLVPGLSIVDWTV